MFCMFTKTSSSPCMQNISVFELTTYSRRKPCIRHTKHTWTATLVHDKEASCLELEEKARSSKQPRPPFSQQRADLHKRNRRNEQQMEITTKRHNTKRVSNSAKSAVPSQPFFADLDMINIYKSHVYTARRLLVCAWEHEVQQTAERQGGPPWTCQTRVEY